MPPVKAFSYFALIRHDARGFRGSNQNVIVSVSVGQIFSWIIRYLRTFFLCIRNAVVVVVVVVVKLAQGF